MFANNVIVYKYCVVYLIELQECSLGRAQQGCKVKGHGGGDISNEQQTDEGREVCQHIEQ